MARAGRRMRAEETKRAGERDHDRGERVRAGRMVDVGR